MLGYAVKSEKVSHSGCALLYALMDKWNSLHRPMGFNITNAELMRMAHFGSHVSLDKAKKELAEAGLIRYEVSQKRFGSMYHLLFGAWAGVWSDSVQQQK